MRLKQGIQSFFQSVAFAVLAMLIKLQSFAAADDGAMMVGHKKGNNIYRDRERATV